MSRLPAVAGLLPHGPEAIALDAVTAWEAGRSAAARVRIRPTLGLYDEALDGIPAWAGIEIMAQTAGVYLGLAAAAVGRPRSGYLIGVRRFVAHRPLFEAELDLDSEARCVHCEQPAGLATFDCRIRHGAAVLASASLAIWRPRRPDQANKIRIGFS